MKQSRLFTALPPYVCTPDGMAIDRHGNLIVSCPNYAQDDLSGCVLRIDRNRNITKWFDVPVHPETGIARNMGIAFDDQWNIYLCDNQGWSGKEELQNKGRILRLTVTDDGTITDQRVIAFGMEHPNGIRIKGNFMYVTQSMLSPVHDPSGLLVSCVYRFGLEEENIAITNTLSDRHILATFITRNPDCQYGADGIVFDKNGDLLVGNFGDGEVIRIRLDAEGGFLSQSTFAQDRTQLDSTDGMIEDKEGNLYIADFSANAICRVTPDGKAERIAQSPDCTGNQGGLDQPGEPIIWDGKLIASCFDLVTGPGKVNLKHEMPAALVMLDLDDTP